MSQTKPHSSKVPKIYKVASKVLELVKEKKANIKDLVLNKSDNKKLRHPNTKGLYALVVSSTQNSTVLDRLIRESQILIKEPGLDPWLARILMVELLWGKKKLPMSSDAKPIRTVLKYHSDFLGILRKDVQSGKHENKPRQHKGATKPRYIRVNTLKMSVNDAIAAIRKEGWKMVTYPAGNFEAFREKLVNLGESEFIQDFHMKELFAFPPRTEFHQHELYRNGSFALQDKATSLAPFLLNPEPGSSVLDMCAAPGMKTTHLAAIMKNKGNIYAVERHSPRYRTMCQLVPHLGVTCVQTINADATTLTPKECRKVKYILVDPSCSGSGMDRPTSEEDETMDRGRLEKLSGFQTILLEKAMTVFPVARRIVYSTCSVYPEENEEVVQKALANVNADGDKWRIADNVLETWPRRGSTEYPIGPKCIATDPEKDLLTGCFIAVLERVGPVRDEQSESEIEETNDNETENKNETKKKRRKKKKTAGNKGNTDELAETSGDKMGMKMRRSESIGMDEAENQVITPKQRKGKAEFNNRNSVPGNSASKKRRTSETVSTEEESEVHETSLNGTLKKKGKKELNSFTESMKNATFTPGKKNRKRKSSEGMNTV